MALCRFKDVSLAFGLSPLLSEASLVLANKERVSLIGRNGAGKSTLLKIIAGSVAPDDGDVIRANNLRVAYLPQELPVKNEATVFSVVAEGLAEVGGWLQEYQLLVSHYREESLSRMERLQELIEANDGWRLQQLVETALQRLNLPKTATMGELSGGWCRRVYLARALVAEPNLLLLDEPTNHLDIGMIQWLEEELLQFDGCILFISHDRMFIDRLATRIIELDRGKLTPWPAPFAAYMEKKDAWLLAEEREWNRFDKKLAEEEAWIRQGIKARRTRNEGRVRALTKLRNERGQRRSRTGQVKLKISDEQLSGKLLAEFRQVSFSYPQAAGVIDNLNWIMMRGDRVGLLGPNGCGKSTLLKLILGQLQPTSGDIRVGTKQQVAYFDQMREQVDHQASVWDNVAKGKDFVTVGKSELHVTGYLQNFLFSPERLRTPARALSGGEINRLLLAKLFTQPANLLVLDEPTNDLDMDTLAVLEAMLAEFDGSLLLVSHDRTFIDNVVTSTLVFEGGGSITEYPGGYSDWLLQRPEANEDSRAGMLGSGRFKTKELNPKSGIGSDGSAKTFSSGQEESGLSASAGNTPKKVAKAKLSYKFKQELEQLPDQVDRLEGEMADMQEAVAAPEFYQQDHEVVSQQLSLLAEKQRSLDRLMERWLELEELQN